MAKLQFLFLVLIAASLRDSKVSSSNVIGRKKYESTCETLPSKLHITKEEFASAGELRRTCQENVAVNKCEGTCPSSIQPSALNPIGFQKECKCCRESFYREREITLTNCYDADGQQMKGELATMKVSVKEPAGCQCYDCGTSSS